MKPKTLALIYWISTALFAVFFLADGAAGLLGVEEGKLIMQQLGFPVYMLFILGIAKVGGAIALLQNKSHVLKEWAYAGFTFHFIGATLSRAFAGHSAMLIVSPLIFLAFMFVSYALWKKIQKDKSSQTPPYSMQY